VFFFRRRCRACGQPLSSSVAEHLQGRAGATEVELTNFPYRSCPCGKLTRWAFDPGTDFTTQLLWGEGGIAVADGSTRRPRCASCRSELGALQPVELAAEVRMESFAPIGVRARLPGYVCLSCGLAQAPPDYFDVAGKGHAPFDGGKAMLDALRAIGLR
jgi:uncharacterized protein with PIN domain